MFFDLFEFDILEFITGVKLFGIIASSLSNSLILTILQFPRCRKFGTYRYLMMCYTVVDMFYSVSYYVSDMYAHSTPTSYVLFRHYRGKNHVFGATILMQFCIFYILVLAILAVHFIYRYVALCAKSLMPILFTTKRLFVWIGGCVVFGLIVGLWKGYMFYETPYTTEKLRPEFAKHYNLTMEEIIYNGPVYWMCDENEENCHTPKTTILGMGSILIFLSLCLGSMAMFGIKCYIELQKNQEHLSEKTKALQKQLLNALLIQSLIPIGFMYVPVTMLFLSPAFGLGFGVYGNITMVCIAIYPPIDQFAIIYVIRDFREIIKNTVGGISITYSKKETSSVATRKESSFMSIKKIAPSDNEVV